ncbi:MAG: hypothetical protein ACK53Y_23440, partial [bacterium]
VGVLARHHLHWLALRDVHSGSILRYLVAPPKHLHQAVGVFCPRQALQPDMRYLASVVTDLCFDLPYALLQRHGGLHLQETDFRLQAGDFRLPRR